MSYTGVAPVPEVAEGLAGRAEAGVGQPSGTAGARNCQRTLWKGLADLLYGTVGRVNS